MCWHDEAMPLPIRNEVSTCRTGAEQILDDIRLHRHVAGTTRRQKPPGRLENLKELIKALENFENLQGFLEHVALIMDNESDDDGGPKVSIMTLAWCQGAGISRRVPAGVGGWIVSFAALDG